MGPGTLRMEPTPTERSPHGDVVFVSLLHAAGLYVGILNRLI